MHALHALLAAFLLSWFPAQARDAGGFAVQSSQETCLGLKQSECCEQRLDYAGFKALGERLPVAAQVPMRLSCTQPNRVVPVGACRVIATARGIERAQVTQMCAPPAIRSGCQKDGSCRRCVSDLMRLSYRESQNACHAVTFAPEEQKRRVVVVKSAIVVGRDGYEVKKQEYEVR
jgi:hypothetical protein